MNTESILTYVQMFPFLGGSYAGYLAKVQMFTYLILEVDTNIHQLIKISNCRLFCGNVLKLSDIKQDITGKLCMTIFAECRNLIGRLSSVLLSHWLKLRQDQLILQIEAKQANNDKDKTDESSQNKNEKKETIDQILPGSVIKIFN